MTNFYAMQFFSKLLNSIEGLSRPSVSIQSISMPAAGKLFRSALISSGLIWQCLFSNAVLADTLEELSAKSEIREVLTQYSYHWDSKRSSEFSRIFTEGGIMERWLAGSLVEGSRITGRAAILDYAQRSHQGRLADRQTRHHFSAVVFLELTETTAVTENMALITHQTADDVTAFISGSGIYRNSWRKTAQGWRIERRILFTDRFVAMQ